MSPRKKCAAPNIDIKYKSLLYWPYPRLRKTSTGEIHLICHLRLSFGAVLRKYRNKNEMSQPKLAESLL